MFKRIGWDRYIKEGEMGIYLIRLGQGIKWELRYLPHADPHDDTDTLWALGHEPSVHLLRNAFFTDVETQAQRHLREGHEPHDYRYARVINSARRARLDPNPPKPCQET